MKTVKTLQWGYRFLIAIALFLFPYVAAQAQLSCSHSSGTGSSTSQSADLCTNNPDIDADFGNRFYIPDDASPILEVRVNLWIISHPVFSDDDNVNENTHFMTSSSANPVEFLKQQNYLKSIIGKANERVFANGGLSEICLDGSVTNADQSVDTRVRLVLNKKSNNDPAIYYEENFDLATGLNSDPFDLYVKDRPEYEDAINIIFIEDAMNADDGEAMGNEDPSKAHIVINKGFGRYVNENPGLEGQNLAHEFNHIAGMFHTNSDAQTEQDFEFECIYTGQELILYDDINGAAHQLNHNMSGGGNNQVYLHPLQAGYLRRMLLTSFRSRFLKNIPSTTGTIIITEDEVIDEGLHWAGDIVIKNGGKLTITETLILTSDSRIFVERGGKLVINGGVITSCSPDVRWQGILVEGKRDDNSFTAAQLSHPILPSNENFAGTVWLYNGATISRAHEAISCNNGHLGWPIVKDYWGGLIVVEGNSTIEDCGRAIELMKYGFPGKLDKSRFTFANFKNLDDGVTIWDSDGVTFSNCNFENIHFTGIFSVNAAVDISNGNDFTDINKGVLVGNSKVNTTNLSIGSFSGAANTFDNILATGIEVYSKNGAPFVVRNNIFKSSNVTSRGILIIDASNFEIRRNTFENINRGIVVFDTGQEYINLIQNNNFDRPNWGVWTLENNGGLQIKDNCMESQISNIRVDEAAILAAQGSAEREAGNCFGQGVDVTNHANNSALIYHVWNQRPESDCEYPNFATNNNVEVTGASSPAADFPCGVYSAGDPPCENPPCEEPPFDPTCELGETVPGTIALIESIELEMQENAENTFETFKLMGCKSKNLGQLYKLYITAKNYDDAFTYFSQRSAFHERNFALSALMEKEDYIAAAGYLENINPGSLSESKYVEAQYINFQFMQNMLDYELSPGHYEFLKSFALERSAYSGYAASIFGLITGESIEFPLEEAEEAPVESRLQKDEVAQVQIFPNPVFMDELTILTPTSIKEYTAQIFDAQGRQVQALELTTGENLISTIALSQGVYILKIQQGNEISITEKITVIR